MHRVIFGGTFDPIHVGHLLTARAAMEILRADGVVLVPAQVSPHKMGIAPASGAHRLAMCKLAVEGTPGFSVSDVEMLRGGSSFTIDTVLELSRSAGNDAEFTLLMGADQLPRLHTWHRVEDVLARVRVGVLGREGSTMDLDALRENAPRVDLSKIQALPTPVVEVSATEIRQRVREGKSIRWLVPEAVAEYIRQNQLYHG